MKSQRTSSVRVLAAGCILACVSLGTFAEEPGPTVDDYRAAAALLPGKVDSLVKNASVLPHWLEGTHRFWYRRDGITGPEFATVDTRTGAKTFARDAPPANSDPAPDPELILSPDRSRAVLVREFNLFVRDMTTGRETALTTDGAPSNAWAGLPGDSLIAVRKQRTGLRTPPFNTSWSDDGRYIVTTRVDERNVAPYSFVEWAPEDGARRPKVHEARMAFTGDAGQQRVTYFLFDLQRQTQIRIEFPADYLPYQFDRPVLGWSRKRKQAFLIARTRGSRAIAVFRMALDSGSLTKVLEETSTTRVEANTNEYQRANLRLLGDGAELLWYSDRSGYGHLYLYDAQTGTLKRAVSSGKWQVFDIEAIDESQREVYFTAGGRENGHDPYYRQLYRASLDRPLGPQLLTSPDADHDFGVEPSSQFVALARGMLSKPARVRPDLGVFIDTASTVNEPPVITLRSTKNGRQIVELERADVAALYAAGWRAPVRERVKAADGVTDLYAVYYEPRARTTSGKYPIVDAAYGGPQVRVAPVNFSEAYQGSHPVAPGAMARLGFGVVIVDGRGTPERNKAFRDAGYPEFTRVGIEDHVAAIQQIAQRHPALDLKRVGIYGWSWGGTFSAQAILTRPEFYRVAVSGAGVYDYAAMYPGFDAYIGPPSFGATAVTYGAPDDSPLNWQVLDITRMADHLAGHLLIIYGDLDENVPAHQAMRLAAALNRAGKSYDLMYQSNRTHGAARELHTISRTWDYFVEHLMRDSASAGAVTLPSLE